MADPMPVNFHERKHAYPHDDVFDHSHHHHHHDDHQHRASVKKLPVIPDLRFEYSYLRSIRPYVKVERVMKKNQKKKESSEGSEDSYTKVGSGGGKGREVAQPSETSEIITVQWGKVTWVTLRDQVISPMLQGLLWYVSISSTIVPSLWVRYQTRLILSCPPGH